MNKLPEALRDQVIEALGGPAADEGPDEYVYWNDPSVRGPHDKQAWKPVGAAAEAVAAQEDAAKEQATTALQENDVAHPPSAEQEETTPPPSAEQEQKNDVACRRTSEPSAEPFDAAPATRLRPPGRGGPSAGQAGGNNASGRSM